MSHLTSLIARLKFELEGDFKRHEVEALPKKILNVLDSFLFKMLPEETEENRKVLQEIKQNIGNDIKHFKCIFCNKPAKHWTGSSRLCDFHFNDEETNRIIVETDRNLKSGFNKLDE